MRQQGHKQREIYSADRRQYHPLSRAFRTWFARTDDGQMRIVRADTSFFFWFSLLRFRSDTSQIHR